MKRINKKNKWDNIIKLSIAIDLIGVFLFLFMAVYQVFTRCLGCKGDSLNLNFLFYTSMILIIIGCILLIFSSIKKKGEK
jgi:hypothetical protein